MVIGSRRLGIDENINGIAHALFEHQMKQFSKTK